MKRLILIGAVTGAIGVIFRGFSSWKSALVEKAGELKEAIKAAQTVEELEAVVW